jgi:hypothetical protein
MRRLVSIAAALLPEAAVRRLFGDGRPERNPVALGVADFAREMSPPRRDPRNGTIWIGAVRRPAYGGVSTTPPFGTRAASPR